MSLCPESVLWQNSSLDLDAVSGGEWGRLRDGCIRWRSMFPKGNGCFGVFFTPIGLNGVLSVFLYVTCA